MYKTRLLNCLNYEIVEHVEALVLMAIDKNIINVEEIIDIVQLKDIYLVCILGGSKVFSNTILNKRRKK